MVKAPWASPGANSFSRAVLDRRTEVKTVVLKPTSAQDPEDAEEVFPPKTIVWIHSAS
jgi:hypothetical protein